MQMEAAEDVERAPEQSLKASIRNDLSHGMGSMEEQEEDDTRILHDLVDGMGSMEEHEEKDKDEEEDSDPQRPAVSLFNIDKQTVELLASTGITHFTPIQAQSYDMLLAGQDVLGRSRTGTGKTLAFALPLVQQLAAEAREGRRAERGRTPRCIVIAPTRELAKQVAGTFDMLARPHRLSVATFHGGVPYPPQQRALSSGDTRLAPEHKAACPFCPTRHLGA